MEKDIKKPQIRFQGFTKEWEQRKVQQLIDEQIIEEPMDGNHGEKHPKASDYVERGIPFLMASDIKNGMVDLIHCNFISEKIAERLDKGFAKEGDILLTHKATIGETAILKGLKTKYAILTPQVTYYRILNKKRLNERYLYACFISPTFQNEIKIEAIQSTRAYIGIQEQHKLSIWIPNSLKEQEKIGEFFKQLDNLISLHQRKYDSLVKVKKSMLEKMFPRRGAKKPEIRFAGFTDDWEQRKVIDLLELLTDYDANGSFADMAANVNTFDGSGYAWYVRMTDLENSTPLSELKYVDEKSYNFLKKTHLHGGELLIAKRGDIGKVYIFKNRTKRATLAPNMYLLKLNNKVIPKFLYNFFISSIGNNQLKKLNASTTMGALYKDDVKNIDVTLPSLSEQKKIGDFFKKLDNLISLHQRKLNLLKNIKKAMLEKMFV